SIKLLVVSVNLFVSIISSLVPLSIFICVCSSISFVLASLATFLFFEFLSKPAVAKLTPPIDHPIGPLKANNAEPAAVPPPPATKAPPPNHAKAALVAAAPLKADIAVPVEAVPNVVAIAIAADGPNAATPTPATTPPPALPAVFFND